MGQSSVSCFLTHGIVHRIVSYRICRTIPMSVLRLSRAGIKTSGRIDLFFREEASSHLSFPVPRGHLGTSKIRVPPSGTLSRTRDSQAYDGSRSQSAWDSRCYKLTALTVTLFI